MSQDPIFISAEKAKKLTSWIEAIDALKQAMLSGYDPEKDVTRPHYNTSQGELFIMPAWNEKYVGLKILTSTPGNKARNLPLIQGSYVLYDGVNGMPLAYIDGSAITYLRTSSVSCLMIQAALRKKENNVVVFGAGIQARAHIDAIRSITQIKRLSIVEAHPDRAKVLVEDLKNEIAEVQIADNSAVETADIIVCCTTSAVPLFDGTKIQDSAVVVAMGAYLPEKRETDSNLVRRSFCVVESKKSASAEAGDLLQAIDEGVIKMEDVHTLSDVLNGRVPIPETGPIFFKTTGMAWEDLVVAARIYEIVSRE